MTTLTIDQLKEAKDSIIKTSTYRIGAKGVKPVMNRLLALANNNEWLVNYKANTVKQLTEEVIKMVIKYKEFESKEMTSVEVQEYNEAQLLAQKGLLK